jgi:malate dehydrogenase (oxaloacetate-decarboxylating)(NADP+)
VHNILIFCPSYAFLLKGHIATHLLEELAGEVFIGPILNGFEYPVQIIPMGSSATDILEVVAFAIMDCINSKK